MEQRLNYYEIAPEAFKVMLDMEKYLQTVDLDKKLIELIKLRVSLINGCAYCINIHTMDAKKIGESDKRLHCISAYKECSFYTDEEKIALELAEHITNISTQRVPDTLYKSVRKYYNEKQYTDLVILINQINSWNRISISMGNIAK